MRKFILTFILFLFVCNVNAQNFSWARKAGSIAYDLGWGIATDNSGNVIVAGKYEYNANFNGTYVSCAGNHDIFVAKYNTLGGLLWVKTAGGIGGDYAHAVCTDAAGNIYVVGEIEQTARFSSLSVKAHGAHNDIFLAKYSPSGALLWVKAAGGYSNDQALGISADASGNVYVTGQFQTTAYFNTTTLVSSGGMDIFIAKYNTNGDLQWVRKAGGGGSDQGYGIKADATGNCYVTGYFNGTAKFGSTSLSSSGGNDVFLAKYSTDGILLWAKRAGGGANDYGSSVTVNNSGQVFITGGCRLYSSFGALSVKVIGGDLGVFVACYNAASGEVQWVKKGDGGLNDSGRGICVDAFSNVYIIGQYGKSALFDTKTLTGVDTSEIFFASYTSTGAFRWALSAGGSADAFDDNRYLETGLAISVDNAGNVYGSGMFRTNITFGKTTLPEYNRHTDIFVTKIVQSLPSTPPSTTLTATITASGPTTFCSGGSVLLNANIGLGYTYQWVKDGVNIPGATNSSYIATTSGVYQVTVTYQSNTLRSGRVTVTVNTCTGTPTTLTAATITASGPTTFCSGGNVVLNSNTGQGYIYQWKKNGAFISGATNPSYTVTTSGDYQIKITQGTKSVWSAPLKVTVNTCTGTSTTLTAATITASGPTTFCSGGNVVLNSNTGQGYIYQWKKNGALIPGATASSYTVTTSGDYQIKITQGTKTVWSAPLKVTVNTCAGTPTTTLTATITASGPTTFCLGGNVVLNSNTGQGYVYQWKKNGSVIVGANNSSYMATTPGDYQIKIISGSSVAWSAPKRVIVNNCKMEDSLSFQQLLADTSINVSNSAEPLQLKVYPNPTSGEFSIEIINMNNFNAENITIQVLNEMGQVVFFTEPNKVTGQMKKTIELDSRLPSGIYLLKVKIGDKEENTRLVLAK